MNRLLSQCEIVVALHIHIAYGRDGRIAGSFEGSTTMMVKVPDISTCDEPAELTGVPLETADIVRR